MTETIKVLCELTFEEVSEFPYSFPPGSAHICLAHKHWKVTGIPDPTQPPPTTEFEREIMKKMAADNELARTQYAIGEKRLEVFNPLSGEFRTSVKAEDGEVLSPHAIYRLAPKPEPRYEPLDVFGILRLRMKYLVDAQRNRWRVDRINIPRIDAPLIFLTWRSCTAARTAEELLNEGWTYEDGTPVGRKMG